MRAHRQHAHIHVPARTYTPSRFKPSRAHTQTQFIWGKCDLRRQAATTSWSIRAAPGCIGGHRQTNNSLWLEKKGKRQSERSFVTPGTTAVQHLSQASTACLCQMAKGTAVQPASRVIKGHRETWHHCRCCTSGARRSPGLSAEGPLCHSVPITAPAPRVAAHLMCCMLKYSRAIVFRKGHTYWGNTYVGYLCHKTPTPFFPQCSSWCLSRVAAPLIVRGGWGNPWGGTTGNDWKCLTLSRSVSTTRG